MSKSEDEFTEQEAADQLLVSKKTLSRARSAGEIDYIRDGRKIVYTREQLSAYESRMAGY